MTRDGEGSVTDRERLIEVMARGICASSTGRNPPPALVDALWREFLDEANAAVDAAERAGFRWIGPDDGR